MNRPSLPDPAPVADHGGSLAAVARRFPNAPHPWIDLSTGINPHPYPLPALPPDLFQRLPEPGRAGELLAVAAATYGAGGADEVTAAPGTQILLPLVMALVPPGRAAVLSPTYAEHARAAALAGHQVQETARLADLADADLAVLVNPNNPDGRVTPKADLLALARTLAARGGLLVVDEAFMDVGPPTESLVREAAAAGAVVLRSFGKFFGLGGVRLGFAIGAPERAAALAARLGPWAVSGPALEIGIAALADHAWQDRMRLRLEGEAARLDTLLAGHGLTPFGGTGLFRLCADPHAGARADVLAAHGIHVRRFAHAPHLLRFGLPADDDALARLAQALTASRAP